MYGVYTALAVRQLQFALALLYWAVCYFMLEIIDLPEKSEGQALDTFYLSSEINRANDKGMLQSKWCVGKSWQQIVCCKKWSWHCTQCHSIAGDEYNLHRQAMFHKFQPPCAIVCWKFHNGIHVVTRIRMSGNLFVVHKRTILWLLCFNDTK